MKPIICKDCNTEMRDVEIDGLKDLKVLVPKLFTVKSSDVQTVACPNCGKINLIVLDKSIL